MKLFSKLSNFLILFLCLLYYPFRGKADNVPKDLKKILVLRWKQSMGDIVYITPLFRHLKQKFSNSRLYMMGRGRVKDVIENSPYVDGYIPFENNFWTDLKRVKALKVDAAFLANSDSTYGFGILFLAGVPGISVLKTANKEGRRSFTFDILSKLAYCSDFYTGTYIPREYLKLLKMAGIKTEDTHFNLYFSPQADGVVTDLLLKNNISPGKDMIVAFSPGGSTEERWWPADRFARLAGILYKEYKAKILIVGAGKDEKAISVMTDRIDKDVPYLNLFNQSLDEFKATISKCSLVIGNDSGPMVTADAFDVAQMIFVGPTDPKEYHTSSGPTYRILQASSGKVSDITLDEGLKELYYIMSNLKR